MSSNNVIGNHGKWALQDKVNPNIPAYDSNGDLMIVGDKYEMYAPVAKQVRNSGLGIVWKDNIGFSFTYLGVLQLHDHQHIGTLDVSYNPDIVPPEVYQASVAVTEQYGACPLCPVQAAAHVVRPVTHE